MYFSFLTHTKQLLLVTFCDTTAGIGNSKVWQYTVAAAIWKDRRKGWKSYVDNVDGTWCRNDTEARTPLS